METIKNRHGQAMRVSMRTHRYRGTPENPVQTVIIEHGRSGSSRGHHNAIIAGAFYESGYDVISLNATNSQNNRSDGTLTYFTMEKHYTDFEDCIRWAIDNDLVVRNADSTPRFAVSGHSMGGYSAMRAAATFKDSVFGCIAVAPVLNGTRHIQARFREQPELMVNWQKTGLLIEPSILPYGAPGYLPFDAWSEWKKHDLFSLANQFTSSVHIIAGGNDKFVTADVLTDFDKVTPPNVTIETIEGADHTFLGDNEHGQGTIDERLRKRTAKAASHMRMQQEGLIRTSTPIPLPFR